PQSWATSAVSTPRFSATHTSVRTGPAQPGADTADVAHDWGIAGLLPDASDQAVAAEAVAPEGAPAEDTAAKDTAAKDTAAEDTVAKDTD
ncbi:hypothetical protein P1P70_43665, partial [Streptomyces sp. MB09-02B]|nr:hypothetical protein [Streptomyces sp. MB09-02B]